MLRFDINSAPGYLWHVCSVADISMVHATMKMETNIQQDKVLTIIQNPTKKIYKN
jgi:hypothetical protein